METIKFGRWIVEVDASTTRLCYERILSGSPEGCTCDPCRNFAARRGNIYPHRVKELLGQLGIDWHKEAEICHYGRLSEGIHFYSGWFHFVGRVLEGADAWAAKGTADFEPVSEDFALGFSRKKDLLADSFDGYEVVQVEFTARTPWSIDAPEVE